jgi:hypothetical protein
MLKVVIKPKSTLLRRVSLVQLDEAHSLESKQLRIDEVNNNFTELKRIIRHAKRNPSRRL